LYPKCDEEKPQCKKCVARDAVCIYPSPNLTWVRGKSASTPNREGIKNKRQISPPVYSSSPKDEALQPVSPTNASDHTLNLENIDLIIYWFTATVHTVNPPAAIHICQTLILKQAMQHHFLLHGILALSALHLADSHADPENYTRIATSHHTRGLALYHTILADINKANYSASIAFSSITAIFALALARPSASKAVEIDLVLELAQIFQLSKGWHKVVQAADSLKCTGSSSLVKPHEISTASISADTEAAFGRLHALNQENHAAVYTAAISTLKTVFEILEGTENDNPHVALEWVSKMPEDFIYLMKERLSLALVILAHYCVVLYRAPRVWWLRGWSEGLFGVIWRGIDPVYRDSMQWARQQIGFAV
jgi:hypothetical protein